MDSNTKNNIDSLESVIKQSTKKKSLIFDFKKTWLAYLILIVLVLVSFFVKGIVADRVQIEMDNEFEKAYTSVESRLHNQIERLIGVERSTQGIYYEVVQVVRDYFELNGAVPLKNYNSILCISYAPKVDGREWGQFQYNALCQGYNEYILHPASNASYYYPVEHIVRFQAQGKRLAFDYASMPEMKKTIEDAAADAKSKQRNDMIYATEFFNLRPDTLSFAFVAPIFDHISYSNLSPNYDRFVGSVVMEVNAIKLFEDALIGEQKTGENKFASDTSIIFKIFDGNTEVFKSNNYDAVKKEKYTPICEDAVVDVPLADRTLKIQFSVIPNFGGSIQGNLATLVLVALLLLSVLAFILIIVLLTQKARAEEIAEKMTASQRRILETSRDIIAVVASDGKWLSMNAISKQMLGKDANDVIGTNITDYLFDVADVSLWNYVLTSKEERHSVAWRVKSDNAMSFIWVSWNFTKPTAENLIYAIGRDVTSEYLAAEAAKIHSKQIELVNLQQEEVASSKLKLMIDLDHEMRNRLTSIMGYLQLVTNKTYENEDEMMAFVSEAYENSEHAYSFIHDMAEKSIGDANTTSNAVVCQIKNSVTDGLTAFRQNNKYKPEISFKDATNAKIKVNADVITNMWSLLFGVLTRQNRQNVISIQSTENSLEGITEIVIGTTATPGLVKVINAYNTYGTKNVVNCMSEDIDDLLFDIAKIASYIARMSGTFAIDLLDDDKEVYVSIQLPL